MLVEEMAEDPTDFQVARHLETYLLWLFGWVMFISTHGNTVDVRWIAYAQAIANTDDDDDVSQVSWGSADLGATYFVQGMREDTPRVSSDRNCHVPKP